METGYTCGRPTSKADCGAEIKVTSRAAGIAHNTELVESMVLFMQQVGINAKAQFVGPSINLWWFDK